MRKWTEEEESLVRANLERYNNDVMSMPLSAMSEKLGRTPDAIRRKATRLKSAPKPAEPLDWPKEASLELWELYSSGMSTLDIHKSMSFDVSLADIELKIPELKEGVVKSVRKYAESIGLPCAKVLRLETLRYFWEHRKTTSDFTRKILHGKIKNG